MAKEDKDTFHQTEKALKQLIEKTQNENSALSKILKVLNTESDQNGETKPSKKETEESLNK
jgi:hypothetical protein